MSIGEKIRELRLERGLSEEQFASIIGVTWRDVLNWEKEKEFPPVNLIPKIAGYFNVTTDALFGMDQFDTEALINPYIEKYQQYVSENKLPEAIATVRDGLIHFPDEFKLKCMLLYALFLSCNRPAAVKHYSAEIIELADDILNNCTDDAIRLEAKRILCLHYYDDLHETNSAVEIARTLPSRNSCREDMMSHILSGDKKRAAIEQNIASYAELLCENIKELAAIKEDISKEEMIAYSETAIKVLSLIYSDGDYLRSGLDVMRIYKELGMFCMNHSDADRGFEYLEKAALMAKEYDTLPSITKHTSPLVDMLSFDKAKADPPELATNTTVCRALIEELMKLDAVDSLRYDERLQKIADILSGK